MDVDGSYLWRKQQQLKESGVLASISATITVLPSPPLSGWVTINESNYKEICLRRNHIYFAQIQGQMAVGLRPWCDFVVYTTKGVSVQRIQFDNDYWDNELLPKLIDFYETV